MASFGPCKFGIEIGPLSRSEEEPIQMMIEDTGGFIGPIQPWDERKDIGDVDDGGLRGGQTGGSNTGRHPIVYVESQFSDQYKYRPGPGNRQGSNTYEGSSGWGGGYSSTGGTTTGGSTTTSNKPKFKPRGFIPKIVREKKLFQHGDKTKEIELELRPLLEQRQKQLQEVVDKLLDDVRKCLEKFAKQMGSELADCLERAWQNSMFGPFWEVDSDGILKDRTDQEGFTGFIDGKLTIGINAEILSEGLRHMNDKDYPDPLNRLRSVLLHEIMHACSRMSGRGNEDDSEIIEFLCTQSGATIEDLRSKLGRENAIRAGWFYITRTPSGLGDEDWRIQLRGRSQVYEIVIPMTKGR